MFATVSLTERGWTERLGSVSAWCFLLFSLACSYCFLMNLRREKLSSAPFQSLTRMIGEAVLVSKCEYSSERL